MLGKHASWDMTYPDIGHLMQCSGKDSSKRYMHLVSYDYCLFFKYTIKAKKANILHNYGLITQICIPVSLNIAFFYRRYLFPHTHYLSAVALALIS